jgi:hypothetical protein
MRGSELLAGAALQPAAQLLSCFIMREYPHVVLVMSNRRWAALSLRVWRKLVPYEKENTEASQKE